MGFLVVFLSVWVIILSIVDADRVFSLSAFGGEFANVPVVLPVGSTYLKLKGTGGGEISFTLEEPSGFLTLLNDPTQYVSVDANGLHITDRGGASKDFGLDESGNLRFTASFQGWWACPQADESFNIASWACKDGIKIILIPKVRTVEE
ncbi:uncharacterized protein ASCRUDRAFT_119776 [Ascoidea rubescens DSM 1968]|uniref:Uncharacterized protein n=1 Tax=Ascoidea rubescens DSM 1968 TaxID=1344418 RepID=A0A1D2VAC2_9ASCO|nr:hypothetical protein ASCRUDRAFT_119776 [Ascoidea rubescens DSM 1968]ODV58561.1 hypothetical protein ASCRUDRAFT_119776 [Ascoidea rubescens DSM 1968]